MKPADKAPGGGGGRRGRGEGEGEGARRCPLCGKPAAQAYRPFCSKRCADIDLARWLGGRYAIPGEAAPGDEGQAGDADDA